MNLINEGKFNQMLPYTMYLSKEDMSRSTVALMLAY